MANDKRDEILEAARIWLNRNCPSRLIKEYDASRLADFAIAYAAATAEGIPQADGWVAIKSIADLPTVNGRYVTQEWSGILRIQDYDSHRRKLWFSSVLAYLPKPIQPYQRPSREGDSNER